MASAMLGFTSFLSEDFDGYVDVPVESDDNQDFNWPPEFGGEAKKNAFGNDSPKIEAVRALDPDWDRLARHGKRCSKHGAKKPRYKDVRRGYARAK